VAQVLDTGLLFEHGIDIRQKTIGFWQDRFGPM